MHIQVILPLALAQTYSYSVPIELQTDIAIGKRVSVQFGKKRLYAGIVYQIFEQKTDYTPENLKPILSILDEQPILLSEHIQLWEWTAEYYMCSLGEVMIAALPSAFKLSSESIIHLSPIFDGDFSTLSNDEYLLVEALNVQDQLKLEDVQAILNKKTVYFIVKSLVDKGVILVIEKLNERFKPKTAQFVRLTEEYTTTENAMQKAFELTTKSEKQTRLLLAFMQLEATRAAIQKTELQKVAASTDAIVKALVKKGIFELYEKQIDRLSDRYNLPVEKFTLSEAQETVKNEILENWQSEKPKTTLLHGLTSSGKTQIYIELIQQILAEEKNAQALFLLPEIALTGQMINRLRKVFGSDVGIYHSKFNPQERVEIWHKTLNGQYRVVVGARSAIFLPFQNLKLIVVDEEHDSSYKQHSPAPRYNARDLAIWYAHNLKARIILGSATPSIESYYNATGGKFQLCHIGERYGGVLPPEIELIDLKKEKARKRMKSDFSQTLVEAIEATLKGGEQVILFKNRRGYSPYIMCGNCQKIPSCNRCDVSLTYHKYINSLKCHYCGYQERQKDKCGDCGTSAWEQQGFGTEKVEDDLKNFFPEIRVQRMDLETTRSKNGYLKIIQQFEDAEVDVLVGTQMVTKGLDFDNVGMVGVLSADQMMFYPNFRAIELAFQLLLQVAGRAGRREKQGKVFVQTSLPNHFIFQDLQQANYERFYGRELQERHQYSYPPFSRMIQLTLKHRNQEVANKASTHLVKLLNQQLRGIVLGPTTPAISKIRDYYIRDILIKFPRHLKGLLTSKEFIKKCIQQLKTNANFKSLVVQLDIDP